MLLVQVASGQKLRRDQQVSPESPDSPFDYIPPKVKLLHNDFLSHAVQSCMLLSNPAVFSVALPVFEPWSGASVVANLIMALQKIPISVLRGVNDTKLFCQDYDTIS